MINDRIKEACEFMKDDNFIRTGEFNSFIFKVKQNELALQMKPRDLMRQLLH